MEQSFFYVLFLTIWGFERSSDTRYGQCGKIGLFGRFFYKKIEKNP